MPEIRARIREYERAQSVAVAREELLLRGATLHPETDAEGGSGSDEELPRIPGARRDQQLWAQHKYSVLARDPGSYEKIGRRLAEERAHDREADGKLVEELDAFLRRPPEKGPLTNALQHLWGYVSERDSTSRHGDPAPERLRPSDDRLRASDDSERTPDWSEPLPALRHIGRLAREQDRTYLLHSTALSDLAGWLAYLSEST